MLEHELEFYLPPDDGRRVSDHGASARAAGEALTRRGTVAAYRRSIFVRAQETLLRLAAESAGAVRGAPTPAVPCDRITAVPPQAPAR